MIKINIKSLLLTFFIFFGLFSSNIIHASVIISIGEDPDTLDRSTRRHPAVTQNYPELPCFTGTLFGTIIFAHLYIFYTLHYNTEIHFRNHFFDIIQNIDP